MDYLPVIRSFLWKMILPVVKAFDDEPYKSYSIVALLIIIVWLIITWQAGRRQEKRLQELEHQLRYPGTSSKKDNKQENVYEEIQKIVGEVKTQAKSMQSGFEEHKREEETLKDKLATLTSTIEEQIRLTTAQGKSCDDLKPDVEKIGRAAGEANQTLKEFMTEQERKILAIEQTSAQLKAHITSIQNVKNDEKLNVHLVERSMTKDMDSLREALNELKFHIANIQRETKEGACKAHDLMKASATQQEDINVMERSSKELKSYIADIQRLAKEEAEKVQVLEKHMADEKKDLEVLQKASTTFKTDILDIQREAKEATTQVNYLNKSYTDQQKDLVVLQNTSTDMKTNIAEIQREAKQEGTKVQHLQKCMTDLQKDLQQLEKESTDMRTGQGCLTKTSEEHMRQIQELQREEKENELKLYKQQEHMEKNTKEYTKMIKQLNDKIENVATLQKTYVNQTTFRSGLYDLEYSSTVHSRNLRKNISGLERLINKQFDDLVTGLQRVPGFHPTHTALHRADEDDDMMYSKSSDDAGQLRSSREDNKAGKAKGRRKKSTEKLQYTTTPSTSDLDSVRDQSTGRFVPDVYLHSSGDEAGFLVEASDQLEAGGNHFTKQTEFGTAEDNEDDEDEEKSN